MIGNKQGITLIEILIVLMVLGLLGFFYLPKSLNSVETNKKATDLANAKLIYNASKEALIHSQDALITEEWIIPVTREALIRKDDYSAFKQALLKELESNLPLPSYTGKGVGKARYFVIKIDKEGKVAVLTGSEDEAFIPVHVAPVPDIAYEPQL
jgi:prepilin-type N-terminal cleavage/methylation domain-containing protein